MICLMQTRVLLVTFATKAHSCLMSWCPSEIPMFFLLLSLNWCLRLFFSRCKMWHFYQLNFMRLLSACFFGLSRSLWVAAQIPGASTTPRYVICRLAVGCSLPFIQVINEGIEQYWPQYRPLEYATGLMTGLQLDIVLLITTLWASHFSQLLIRLISLIWSVPQ